jgi:hypothetical protein
LKNAIRPDDDAAVPANHQESARNSAPKYSNPHVGIFSNLKGSTVVLVAIVLGVLFICAVTYSPPVNPTTKSVRKPMTEEEKYKLVCDYKRSRPLADLTPNDLELLLACKQAGY